jgi:hypothetical protein
VCCVLPHNSAIPPAMLSSQLSVIESVTSRLFDCSTYELQLYRRAIAIPWFVPKNKDLRVSIWTLVIMTAILRDFSHLSRLMQKQRLKGDHYRSFAQPLHFRIYSYSTTRR